MMSNSLMMDWCSVMDIVRDFMMWSGMMNSRSMHWNSVFNKSLVMRSWVSHNCMCLLVV